MCSAILPPAPVKAVLSHSNPSHHHQSPPTQDERDSGCEAVTGRDDSTASDGGGAGISDREGSRGTKEGQGKTGRLSGGERARGVGDAVSTSKPPSVVAHAAKSSPRGQSRRELLRLGLLMAFTMTAHNLPEGVAVGVSAFTPLGPIMALAIAVHNVPEGVIVAAPVFAATGSRTRALLAATASGLSEPLGALVRRALCQELHTGLAACLGLGLCVMSCLASSGPRHNYWLLVVLYACMFTSSPCPLHDRGLLTAPPHPPWRPQLAVTLLRSVVTEEWLEGLLAFVGGIMLAVCVMELWPEGRKCGHDGALVKGAALGATAMLWTLWVGV